MTASETIARGAVILAALTVRATFATLAAVTLVGAGHLARTLAVTGLVYIATGAAVRVDQELSR